MFVMLSGAFKRFCIVWPSYRSSSILPSFQSDNRLVSTSRCFFDFEDLLGFEVMKLAWHGRLLELLIHIVRFLSIDWRQTRLIYFFPEAPVGSINIFLFHWMIFSYVSWLRASNLDPSTSLNVNLICKKYL